MWNHPDPAVRVGSDQIFGGPEVYISACLLFSNASNGYNHFIDCGAGQDTVYNVGEFFITIQLDSSFLLCSIKFFNYGKSVPIPRYYILPYTHVTDF